MANECKYEKRLDKLDDEINGNGKPGLHDTVLIINEKLDGILKRQQNNTQWFKILVSVFGILFLGAIYTGITDHLKIERMPYDYVSKVHYDQYIDNVNDKVNQVINAKLTTVKSVLELEAKLQNNDSLFNYLKITRDATKKNPTKEPKK